MNSMRSTSLLSAVSFIMTAAFPVTESKVPLSELVSENGPSSMTLLSGHRRADSVDGKGSRSEVKRFNLSTLESVRIDCKRSSVSEFDQHF